MKAHQNHRGSRQDDEAVQQELLAKHSDLEAEKNAIHRLHAAPWELATVRESLPAEAFYSDTHRAIYRSLLRLGASGADIQEWSNVVEDLREQGELDAIGGPAAVYGFAEFVPPYEAQHYAKRIVRHLPAREAAGLWLEMAGNPRAREDPLGFLHWVRDEADRLLHERQDARSAQRFCADDWSDLWNVEPTEPLVDGLYTMDSNVVVWATWGLGKTAIEMDLAWHLALSLPWHDHAVTGGHVWYIFAEGRAFIAERLKALCKRYGVDRVPSTLHTISLDIPNLLKPGEAEALAGRMRAQTQAGERIVSVVLDTVSGTSAGNKEDNTDMARYAASMTAIRTALPEDRPNVRGIHHPGWGGEHSRGGSALPGAIDTEVKVLEGPGGLCVVHCVKQRGGGSKFASFGYKVVPQVIDEAGHTGPVVEWVTLPSEFAADAQAGKLTPKVAQVYSIFKSILQRFDYRAADGVFPSTWRQACEEQCIDARAYRYARDELLKRGLIVQPDTTTAFFPVQQESEP